ncbi:MAG: amidohydrolase family protein [Clostridia bacterium]|nr:amidohydrolase family protein [Clostridia bacterium]
MTIRDEAYQGLPLSCPIIDAHTHITPYQLSGWHQKYDRTPTEKILEDHERLGIDCIVTIPHQIIQGRMEEANRISEDAIKRFENKVYAYIAVVPTCGMEAVKRELEKYSKNPGFLGLKFLPGFYHGELTVPEYRYAMDFADEMGCPILCHVWDDDPKHSDIENALKTRHNMKFIIAHQGGGSAKYTKISAPIVTDHENAYLELCGSMDNQFGIEDIVAMVGEDKVIFGTDAINLDPKYELGKVAFSPLDDRVKKKIFAENYLSLLQDSEMGKIKIL